MNLRDRIRLGIELSRLPGVRIDLWGDERCRALYRSFTARHPRFPLVQHKRHGVALAPVPDTFASYLAGGTRQALRTNRKRAIERGYTFQRIDPAARLDEILAVNRSANERQGRPMEAGYVAPDVVRASFQQAPDVFGVLDRDGVVRAYLDLRTCGELAVLGRLLGHVDVLDDGVMYLLISEGIREVVERRDATGTPTWVMYDTWYGGGAGIRYFKQRLGFAPYRVRWRWVER